ncbi:hypothetical protein [Brevundimonas sp.]|uniref:hypothetical protein n=1 Tax=Brevundimonas sp. TaxID=1871086 RepID=UPI002D5DACF3|nr:hypothetical protein [Brevundimonas sp.]HYC99263.1 hypothetical protein [Brevundimonas sp.]
MNVTVLEFAIAFLLFAVALTLFLVLRLAARVAALEGALHAPRLQIGDVVPDFEGRRAADGGSFTSAGLAGGNTALIFLSAGCPQCVAKRPDLLAMLPGMNRAEVTFWIVPADDAHDLSEIVGGSALEAHVLILKSDVRRRLNPNNIVPSYLFIDDQMVVQDQSHMEDENWLDFVRQMKAISTETAEPV